MFKLWRYCAKSDQYVSSKTCFPSALLCLLVGKPLISQMGFTIRDYVAILVRQKSALMGYPATLEKRLTTETDVVPFVEIKWYPISNDSLWAMQYSTKNRLINKGR